MRNKILLISLSIVLIGPALIAQDRSYVFNTVSRLAAPDMHGRGYYKDGDIKAAHFLANEMRKAGIVPLWDDFYQTYHFDINTFPGKVNVAIDSKKLIPGSDFVVHPAQSGTEKDFELVWLPDTLTKAESVYQFVDTTALLGKMLVVPAGLKDAYRNGIQGVPALLQIEKSNIWWHVSKTQLHQDETRLKISADKIPYDAKKITVKVDSKLLTNRAAYNVGGYIPGSKQADSMVIFVAHYDHLGQMGKKALFPGASDNASGTATVLDLARYYAANPDKAYYTMVFLLVSGEEAGLLGSYHFADNAPFPIENTRFVINFDMVGTGSQGLAVVNGKAIPQAFELMDSINTSNGFFNELRQGGYSCNSDHCPFFSKNVPAVFLFTFGPENRHYHNVYDVAAQLPFTSYENLFSLVTVFVEKLPSQSPFKIEPK